MEQKYVLWSTLGLGLGVGMGLGLSKGGILKNPSWNKQCRSLQSRELLQLELLSQIIDGKDAGASFDEFPYYLNEQTRILLTNAAFVHLKQRQLAKYTRNLSPASRSILLTGDEGTEAYHQMLAKALANFFEAKLLLLDISDFASKFQAKYGDIRNSFEASGESISGVFVDTLCSSLSNITTKLPLIRSVDVKSSSNAKTNEDTKIRNPEAFMSSKKQVTSLKRTTSWGFDDRCLVNALFKVLSSVGNTTPIVLYLRDVEKLIYRGPKTYALFLKKMRELSGPVLVLGSRIMDGAFSQVVGVTEDLERLFPYAINIRPPQDNACLVSWRSQLEEDMKRIQAQDNKNHIIEVLSANDVECDDLGSVCFNDTLLLSNYIEEIVVSAISHHLMNSEKPDYRCGRLIISAKSLSFGLELFQSGQLDNQLHAESKPEPKEAQGATSSVRRELRIETPVTEMKCDVKPGTPRGEIEKKVPATPRVEIEKRAPSEKTGAALPSPRTKPEGAPDNEFEKRIRPEVIPAGEVGVSFDDIGALDNVKESLQELVMLPLRRPDIFNKGGLIKPCRGILLFGPPGTGKTMLAKAVATEAGASFINVSMSSITSKWFGEDEKNVRALFTLAAKVAPTVIFIDEVDSMLGQRAKAGEHEAMRKIKNEFMAHWDGLLTKGGERILVLAATNRPFDLDEAIIRRFERRIMVGLPDAQNREKILRTILGKENLSEDFNFAELAAITEGYSGSDLKNLCVTAAYWPVRDLLKMEKKQIVESCALQEKDKVTIENEENISAKVIDLRPLTMNDIKEARKQIAASFAAEGSGMAELREWNELYGEGGSRKKQQLSYFM